ncbi:MATE family efflux transporter [Puniceibacterium sediminis]|uniref:Na+-driven multidrug efflux pump n=1 Tax=Puniceibacterium sediminis TaxID=1608407 RepID=A0A238WDG3_9RHOB|nr:MATE family efflux transporter [Puniceibacterium sediminis]SNR44303.1 Na+-driven multidrug efflux pump [Puniceibacterium sediminis]
MTTAETGAATDGALSPTRAIFDMAWPMTLRAMMLHGVVVIDAFLIAGLGEEALAALGLASAVGGLLLGILLAFSNATQILVAQGFGTTQPVALKTGFWCGLIVNVSAALIGLIITLFAAGPIIDGGAHSLWIASEAKQYLAVFTIVVLAEAAGQSLSAHFNGCGETRRPFYSYLYAVPINIVVSLVLIYGLFGFPAFGVTGAALGSAVSAVVRAWYLAHHLLRENGPSLRAPGWLHGSLWRALRRHLAFSLPVAATFISANLAGSVCTLIYARLGVNEFAAMTLIQPWIMVVGTVGMCWAQATGILVAQFLGRGAPEQVLDNFLRQAWRGAFVTSFVVSAIYVTVCLSSGWIYSDLQPETRAALLIFLPTLLFLPFPKNSNAICGNTLRAGGETVYVMHIFVWSQWLFRVPATAALVYMGAPVGWVFSLFLLEELVKFPPFHLRMFKGHWKKAMV